MGAVIEPARMRLAATVGRVADSGRFAAALANNSRRRFAAALGCLCVAALWIFSARAGAQAIAGSPVQLTWNAPVGCPDRVQARADLEQALGSTRLKRAVVRVTIVEAQRGQWSAELWMYGAAGSGEREVRGTSCEQVARAAVLIVALALETLAQPAPAPAPTAPEPSVRFAAGARAALDFGSLPRPDLGLALELAMNLGRLRLEAEASGWLPRSAERGPVAGSGGSFGLYSGGLRGCFELLGPSRGSFALGPCVAVEAGVTVGSGIGVSHPRQSNVFWGAGLAGLSVHSAMLSPLWVGLRVELGTPFFRPTWQIDDFGMVFRAAPLLGRVSIGARWVFR